MSASQTERTVSFAELQQHFRDRYQRDLRDYHGSQVQPTHYEKWCRRNRVWTASQKSDDRSREIYQRYVSAEDGACLEPPYFDFWHWMLKESNYVAWKGDEWKHWKIAPLPTREAATELAMRAEQTFNVLRQMLAIHRIDHHIPNVSDGQHREAVEIIERIEIDFGRPISILLQVD